MAPPPALIGILSYFILTGHYIFCLLNSRLIRLKSFHDLDPGSPRFREIQTFQTLPGILATFYGFTEKEAIQLCTQNEIDFGEIRKWYNGYLLNDVHIYNPKLVVDVMRRREFQSYWTGIETYEALKAYIDLNFDGLREAVISMLGNAHCAVAPPPPRMI